jgi:hypothetical protein
MNKVFTLKGTRLARVFFPAFFVLILAGLLFLPGLDYAQHSKTTSQKSAVCSDCHSCKKPTADNPCLITCPRSRANPKDINSGPETVVLNELEWEYDAVVFNHRYHAEMSAMGGECTDCHHFSEGGRIASCKECHPVGDVSEMKQPGLKAAYHRQCMTCHQTWSGVTSCEMCHAKKNAPGFDITAQHDLNSEPSKRFFPPMNEPEKKVWQSTFDNGSVVTFFHKNHTEKYGVECATCHHAEGCGSCHRKGTTTQSVRHSEEALHGICNTCHAEMSCKQCHLKEEAQPFSHDRTGWPLGKYHKHSACRNCHGEPHHFNKPSPECNSCHSHWNTTTFDHGRTGLVLNETHKTLECENCHTKRDFKAPPACVECHGTDIAYPASLPGEYLKSSR